jgi:hypothetical protein
VEVIDWIQRTGETPIEYLTKTYRSSSAKTEHRISAARTLMDYVHRKMPHTIDVKDTRKNAEQEAANSELFKKIEEMLSSETGAAYTKKERLTLAREKEKLERSLGGGLSLDSLAVRYLRYKLGRMQFERLLERGLKPQVWLSMNLPGANETNRQARKDYEAIGY